MITDELNNTADVWNKRYQETKHALLRPRSFLIDNQSYLPEKGLALDIGMGLGYNAKLLVEHGLSVIGVDFSSIALKKAKVNFPDLQLLLAKLPDIHFVNNSFDLILNFWFLERKLFPMIKSFMKPGGVLVFETMRSDPEIETRNINPGYLLQPGELQAVFSDWDILIYDETHTTIVRDVVQPVTRMVAKRPKHS
jgi:SAM-dependent methyltransferase